MTFTFLDGKHFNEDVAIHLIEIRIIGNVDEMHGIGGMRPLEQPPLWEFGKDAFRRFHRNVLIAGISGGGRTADVFK